MSKPTGYIVRPKDMKALVRQLNRPQANMGELYGAARTLIGWAEPQQTQSPLVSVASLVLPPDEIVCACGEIVTPGHTHPLPLDEPVNVPADPDVEPQPYDMPSPEADALDRIADALRDHTHKDDWGVDCVYVSNLWPILRETGRV